MKPLRWTTNHEQAEYMRARKAQNLAASLQNSNENWFWEKLKSEPHKWSRQVTWGYRVFDFWCHELGAAIEVDGPDHDPDYDSYRDEYNFRRSGLVVLRVRNGNELDAEEVLTLLPKLGNWKARRSLLNLDSHTKKDRRALAQLPRFPSLLEKYLAERRSKRRQTVEE